MSVVEPNLEPKVDSSGPRPLDLLVGHRRLTMMLTNTFELRIMASGPNDKWEGDVSEPALSSPVPTPLHSSLLPSL